ncbi:MAG: hypothetical protein M0P73_09915 [Syntrophobacterales bacterium]|nr:hypothetical protein [Syntrophobacterales bacterium]
MSGAGDRHAFPRPADLADAAPEAMRALGFSYHKARAAIALAQSLLNAPEDLEDLKAMEDAAAQERLIALKGVGRWSAEYALLRGLGRLHVFPGDDVGARKNLQTWLHLDEPLDYEGVRRHLAPWRPYAGFLYFHFLLSHLAAEGQIS